MRQTIRVLTKDEISRKYEGLRSQENFITYHALDLGYEIAFIEDESLEKANNLEKNATRLLQSIFPNHIVYFVYFTDTRDSRDGIVYFAFYKEPKKK